MIFSHHISDNEFPETFSFIFSRDLPKGTRLRIKTNSFHLIMHSIEVTDTDINSAVLTPVFASNDVDFSDVSIWGYHNRALGLTEYVLPCDVVKGDRLSIRLKALTSVPSRAKGKWVFTLLEISDHAVIEGEPCAEEPVEILFTANAAAHIAAYLKSDGRVLVQYFDDHYNAALPDCGEFTVEYADKTLVYRFRAEDDKSVCVTLPSVENVTRVRITDAKGRTAVSNYLPRLFGKNIYFGEFHWHCEFSGDGSRSLYEALHNAEDHLGLDFAGDGDHIWRNGVYTNTHLSVADQGKVFDRVRGEANGKFALIAGCEANGCRGHVNIYARNISELNKCMTSEPDKIRMIGEHPNVWPLRQINDLIVSEGVDAMLIPHHPNTDSYTSGGYVGSNGLPAWGAFPWPGNGGSYGRVRQIEIVQGSGSFETEEYQEGWHMKKGTGTLGGAARTALIKGFKIGFCGGSDDHDGCPTGFLGRGKAVGVTGIMADGLTDDTVYDALYDRHSYATSGAHIVAAARMDGKLMGSQLYQIPGAERKIDIEIHGTAPIELVEIIHAGTVIDSLEVDGSCDYVGSWTDKRPGRPFSEAWYYVRARQTDGECVWLSPFFVDLPDELI